MSADPHTASSEAPDPARSADAADAWRVGLLGLNAWVVIVLFPSVRVGAEGPLQVALAALALAVLAGGLWLLVRGRRELARWILLGATPPALALPIALRPALVEREVLDPPTLLLAVVSMIAWLAATTHAVARPTRVKPALAQVLVGKEPVSEPAARRWTRRALLAITSLGAFAIAVLAPAWTDRSARLEAWGEAADDGAVLTSVAAAIAGALVLGVVVGPGLRAERARSRDAARRRRRLALALLVATLAAAAWLTLRHGES